MFMTTECDMDLTLQDFHTEACEAHPLTVENLKGFLASMWKIRRLEEHAAQAYLKGHIGGFCHLCIGQEAIPVAAVHAMQPQDTMITAYRSHGHAFASGLSARQIMAELIGRATGSSYGKGGSMHIFNPAGNFYGGHGIVGAQVPLGTGLAFAHQYTKDNGVCLAFLGDGASNQGQFFEAMNMAALWSLPVLYIIENNQYAMGTSVERACAGGPLYERGIPFGIKGYTISGDDVITLYAVLAMLIERVRAHQKPLLLEIDTYRFKGHSMSDPGKYRTRDMLDTARHSRDPLVILQQKLHAKGVKEEELTMIHEEAAAHIEAEIAQAYADPEPDEKELWCDILQ